MGGGGFLLFLPAERSEPGRLSEWPAGPSVSLNDTQQSFFFSQLPTTAYITNT